MIISVLNHKGGTGKTTTVVNLGKALAEKRKNVLLVDFDLQANLSFSLGIHCDHPLEVLLEQQEDLSDYLVQSGNLTVLPNLPGGFGDSGEISSPYQLRNSLYGLTEEFDYILIDCPPTISDHALNALCASDLVLIPFQLDVLSVQGVSQVINSITEVNQQYGHQLEILGLVPVMVDGRRLLTAEILDHLKSNYDLHIFNSVVRTNVKIAEAPSFGKSVLEYKPRSAGSQDYRNLASEFIKQTKRIKILT